MEPKNPKVIVSRAWKPRSFHAANNKTGAIIGSTKTEELLTQPSLQISMTPGMLPGMSSNADFNAIAQAKEMEQYIRNKINILKRDQVTQHRLVRLAAFVPDLILKDDGSKVPYQMSHHAVVMMADVSGFTALTEAYSLKGKGGTDQLTKTLGSYIGPLSECILRAGGDIIKYAGDAFLAVWRIEDVSLYPLEVQRVIDCALFMQEAHGSLACPEVNITIKVKIGIGAGMVHACGIGSESYQHWVVFGPGVEAASAGEKHCVPTEIVVSEVAWGYCNPSYYKYVMKDPGFYRVTDIVTFINKEIRGRPQGGVHKGGIKTLAAISVDDSLRPEVMAAKDTKTETHLRTFVIPPILKKLDDDIPIEYLNESRQVCISFIHIELNPFDKKDDFGETMGMIVQKAFIKTYSQATKLQGCLSKVIMFDKGLTYLVIFGLPGYITENQSAHALKFSFKIRRILNNIKYVHDVSIGVTTGSCYCGVVGHPQRQEYTVLGRKVNKAARLMCNYPNRLTCDQDTMYHSKLHAYSFVQMEYKDLKGISNVGKIYEYSDTEGGEDQSVPWFDYPIIGREGELKFLRDSIQARKSEFQTHLLASKSTGVGITVKEVVAQGTWIIAFEGENGVGKTRILSSCLHIASEMNIRAFSVGMNLMLSGQQHFGITSLLLQTFRMEKFRTGTEREDCLRKFVTEPDLISGLCMLNELLQTKFSVTAKFSSMDPTALRLCTQIYIVKLIRKYYPEDFILYIIDDAHLMDQMSWDYIVSLSRTPKIMVICSLRKNNTGSPKLSDTVTKLLYHSRNIKVIRMKGLDSRWCLPLVCQLAEVKAIPIDLEKMLTTKSRGIPAWCDQVIKELLRNGILKVIPFLSGNYGRTEMRPVDLKYLTKNSTAGKKAQLKIGWLSQEDEDSHYAGKTQSTKSVVSNMTMAADTHSASQLQAEEINAQQRMIVVKSDTNIANVSISGTLKEIILDSYDELSSNEQILIKSASILGHKFSRMMLIRILPVFEQNSSKYEASFRHLLEQRHFACATAHKSKVLTTGTPECLCHLTKDELISEVFNKFSNKTLKGSQNIRPRYYNCKFMEFVKDDMIDVVYELMTEDQRKELHLKAAKYLDSSTILCPSCGGEDFSFAFGFARHTNDIAGAEAEQAFRMAATKRKHDQKRQRDYKNRQSMAEIRKTKTDMMVASMETNGSHKRKASLLTQVEGLKKTLLNNGTKVAQIELDIFKAVVEFETKKKNHGVSCCSCFSKNEIKQTEEIEVELEEEIEKEVIHRVEDEPAKDDSKILKTTEATPGVKNIEPGLQGQGDDHNTKKNTDVVDLRTCECAFVQAKVCVEMVRHYRFAEKYGKCLESLLESAESVINIGNGNQAMIHLEDAVGLLTGLKNKDFAGPNPDDTDDIYIDEDEAYLRIDFLNGLANFENGVHTKAMNYFVKALARLGVKLPSTDETPNSKFLPSFIGARAKIFIAKHLFNCNKSYDEALMSDNGEAWSMKLRILSYLHIIFKNDKKMAMARLVTMWQVMIAERYGNLMEDIIPAYCNMMVIYTTLSKHKKAMKYERLALEAIRSSFGTNDAVEAVGMLTTANLFYTLAIVRLHRGSIITSIDAAYLSLQISQTIHDNVLSIRILPVLAQSLLLNLKISELTETLRKLWYTSEEEEDWGGSAMYYALSLEMILDTAYAMEPFSKCLNFIKTNDWNMEPSIFKDNSNDVKFLIETSLALWFARYSKWDNSQLWMATAEKSKPKTLNYFSVAGQLKILECHLILANHYLENKRYQHFAKSRKSTKDLLYSLNKQTISIPCLRPRLFHLQGYYYRLRSRIEDAEKQLKKAEKLARKHGNLLEIEWIAHSRNVWGENAVPTSKNFWLEHTEMHVLDWHAGGKIPWVNIMYSLPIPEWR